jgi:hypothetical protein
MPTNPFEPPKEGIARKRALIAVVATLHIAGFAIGIYGNYRGSVPCFVAGVCLMVIGTPTLYLLIYGHHYAGVLADSDVVRLLKWLRGDRQKPE